MVFVSKQKIASKKWLFFRTTLGFAFLLIPILFLFIDPVLMLAKYYIRLGNGTLLYKLMLEKVNGPRIYLNLFNITNAKEFLSGKDEKVKLHEVGPFVYQEYRLNHDMSINPETNLLSHTPQLWAEFIREESIADPKDVYLTMPNIPFLSGTDMISKYPFFIRNVFNTFTAGLNSEVMMNVSAHDYIWGYSDPLVKFFNRLVPGLIYYDSIGLLERLYDSEAKYTLEIGTKDEDKFSVKKVTKYRAEKNDQPDLINVTQTFTNAYEGAVFPPGMTPDMPLYIYRHSVCKLFKLDYAGTKKTEYGSEGFVYEFSNDTFNDQQLCTSKGWCPTGMMNISPCYKSFRFGVSRGHLYGADPRTLDRLEGIKPDKNIHNAELIIDPKIGVTITGSASLQLNLVSGDLGFNSKTKRLTDIVLPITHVIFKYPPLPPLGHLALLVIYTYGPYVLLTVKILSVALGLGFLIFTLKTLCRNWAEKTNIDNNSEDSSILINGYMPINLWMT